MNLQNYSPSFPAFRDTRYLSAFACVSFSLLASGTAVHAVQPTASDGAADDFFGYAVDQSAGIGLVGAFQDDDTANNSGSAYVFQNLDTASGPVTEYAKLTASDGGSTDYFGSAVSQSGSTGLIGASLDDINGKQSAGSAYVFRNLDTASGTVTQDAKLVASDVTAFDQFGFSVSVSGTFGVAGAIFADGNVADIGSAYVFRNLDTASGTVNENVKLISSDGGNSDQFGRSVSQSGTTALVGAPFWDGSVINVGSAYVFRNMDTASGTVTENVKLLSSGGSSSGSFGVAVSLAGGTALVGASGDDGNVAGAGAAYIFRGLDTAVGTANESAKLIASDGADNHSFGSSVAQSGDTALVGAERADFNGSDSGAVYIFGNLGAASGTVNEHVRVTASDGAANERFGRSVGLDGDQFLIGMSANSGDTGKSYSGSVSSLTTLDTGNTSRLIEGISFVSQKDWIIGENTDVNEVTLGANDRGNVTAAGKSVFIGRNGGSDNNILILEGALAATVVQIGSDAGNLGNTLRIDATGTFDVTDFYLTQGNLLSIEGDYTQASDLLAYLGASNLRVENPNGVYDLLASGNFNTLVNTTLSGGYTEVSASAVPESSAYALLFGLLGSGYLATRRRRRS